MINYKNWLNTIPKEISNDAVWNLKVYRAALYISDLCWQDTQLIKDHRYFSLADQLYRAVGSISANITEGYSRKSLKEKARFYEIALGSARESKGWYFKSRHILGAKLALHRIKLLTSVIKLLLSMITDKRSSAKISENKIDYLISELEHNL
jgi:four helix bundle protein